MSEAEDRARDAWDQRYKHGKAARTWAAVAQETPARREIGEVLAKWMSAYEAADAEAEKAFSEIAAREQELCDGACGFSPPHAKGEVIS